MISVVGSQRGWTLRIIRRLVGSQHAATLPSDGGGPSFECHVWAFYLHNRDMRPPRLPDWHYGRGTTVLLTIVTKNRRPLFGRIEGDVVLLSSVGMIVDQCLTDIPDHFDVQIHAKIVMPEHVHALFTILSTPNPFQTQRDFVVLVPGTLPVIVRSFKSASTRLIREQHPRYRKLTIWQSSYHDRLIKPSSIDRVARYILDNPRNYHPG